MKTNTKGIEPIPSKKRKSIVSKKTYLSNKISPQLKRGKNQTQQELLTTIIRKKAGRNNRFSSIVFFVKQYGRTIVYVIILLMINGCIAHANFDNNFKDNGGLIFPVTAIIIIGIIIKLIIISYIFIIENKNKKPLTKRLKNLYGDFEIHPLRKLQEKIKYFFFHSLTVPFFFIIRLIIRACIRAEGFMHPIARACLINPFYKGLLLNGLYDRLNIKKSQNHLLLVGKTGGGKSSCFVIPNLLSIDNASILTVDISGELFLRSSGAMKQKGYDVKVINPTNLDISQRYNPLEFVKNKRDILEIAHLLIYSNSSLNHKGGDQFWNNGALKLLEILITCLIFQRDKLKAKGVKNYNKFCNLSQLRYLLNNFGEDGQGIENFVFAYADYHTWHDFKGFVSGYSKTTMGFVASALVGVNIFGNEEISKLTANNSIDFKELRKKKTIYYLQVPGHLLHVYSSLIGIFYNQFFSSCMEELPSKDDLDIYALVDEAGHIKLGSNFGTIITNIRKYRCSISLICQNAISQFQTLYGQSESQTIINGGIASHIYFGGCDVATCEMLEKMIGNITTKSTNTNIKEPLMSVAQIRTMLDSEALFLYSNKKPIMLHMKPYYKHSILKKLSEIKPVSFEKKKDNGVDAEVFYMNLESITKNGEVEAFDMKGQRIEEEIDNLNNNPNFSLKEISQKKFGEYMDGEHNQQEIFNFDCLDKKTRGIINIIKDKVIYFYLTKSCSEMANQYRFLIKKSVKKLLDLPDYFQAKKFIRESVIFGVDNIIDPKNPKNDIEHPVAYSQICKKNKHLSLKDHCGIIDILPGESYCQYRKRKSEVDDLFRVGE